VFLLGRIGNNKEALTLIIDRLADVDQVQYARNTMNLLVAIRIVYWLPKTFPSSRKL
jgi:hypothetical protein